MNNSLVIGKKSNKHLVVPVVSMRFADGIVQTESLVLELVPRNKIFQICVPLYHLDNISPNAYDDIVQKNGIILNMTGHRISLIKHHEACANELLDKSLTPGKQCTASRGFTFKPGPKSEQEGAELSSCSSGTGACWYITIPGSPPTRDEHLSLDNITA